MPCYPSPTDNVLADGVRRVYCVTLQFFQHFPHYILNSTTTMRRTSLQAAEKKSRVLEAIAGIKFGKFNPWTEAASLLELSASTVYHRLKDKQSSWRGVARANFRSFNTRPSKW